ncbi:two-component system sensor histidine kinase NtrB [Desulfopila aestuarii]|uniref:histidine kinase n=1 Tax=Desulfopila aestuarii DSM 18488 TaxID=1121416 RepID=A0A1M7YD25_9BACT|nr:ATP-binding protein [Desulfopila aestuarii]SHO50476.1 PAS/PAC sensor signal transduction histidine kinase [Desulfopila aestuarii DSM 18488]
MNISFLLHRAGQTETVNQILRHQLLWLLLLRVVLYTLLSIVSYFFGGASFEVILMPRELMIGFLFTVYLASISSAIYLLMSSVSPRTFGFIQTLLDTLFATLLIYCTGISQSIFTSVYFFPIIAGGLLLPRKGGLVAAAAATLLYGGILFCELYGIVPDYLVRLGYVGNKGFMTSLNHFSVQGLTFFLAAILSALFSLRVKSTELALSKSLKNYDRLAVLYKQIFDNIATGIVTIDRFGNITSANNAAMEITGYPADLIIGREFSRFFSQLKLSAPRMRQSTDFERVDGKTIRLGYSHVDLRHEDDGRSGDFDHQKIVTLRDISEIEQLERQMRQAEKLAAIGMMSAGIAHDFRNPLTAISGSAQVLVNEFSQEGSENLINYELADIILRESNRMIDTISDFLKFSRPELPNREWFSLRGCLSEVIQVSKAAPSWPLSANISVKFSESIDIWADRKMMFTVLSHLIQNALAFCPPGRELIEIDADEIKLSDSGDTIRITVVDNGPGVTEENRDKIFEPFFTSRADGTGLGLAIVRQIITEHDGEITVDSGLLGGARFNVYLPLPS